MVIWFQHRSLAVHCCQCPYGYQPEAEFCPVRAVAIRHKASLFYVLALPWAGRSSFPPSRMPARPDEHCSKPSLTWRWVLSRSVGRNIKPPRNRAWYTVWKGNEELRREIGTGLIRKGAGSLLIRSTDETPDPPSDEVDAG